MNKSATAHTMYQSARTGEIVFVAPVGDMTRAGMAHSLYVYRLAIDKQIKRYFRARKTYGYNSARERKEDAKLFQLTKERDLINAAYQAGRYAAPASGTGRGDTAR